MTLRNIIKEFDRSLGSQDSVLDKNFPKITEKIKLMWGYPEFYLYMEQLLVAEKERERKGFPLAALEELATLHEIHERLFPQKEISANILSTQTK